MSLLRRAAAAAAVTSLAVVGWAVPASSVDDPATTPTGYVTVSSEAGCELAVIDLQDGAVTDLPAEPAEEACVADLAVSTSGVVYGIRNGFGSSSEKGLLAEYQAQLVTFSMDGTPTVTQIVDGEGQPAGSLYNGGIAVSPAGAVYVQVMTWDPTCGLGEEGSGTMLEGVASPVCLFSVDPATGVATPIGSGSDDLPEVPFEGLAWCSGLGTIVWADGPVWATQSTSTGAVTLGTELAVDPFGYDCDSADGGPVYALGSPGNDLNGPGGYEAQLLAVDPATGTATVVAALSDPDAFVENLGVVPSPSSAPAPTSTTTTGPPAAAQAASVTPAFTG